VEDEGCHERRGTRAEEGLTGERTRRRMICESPLHVARPFGGALLVAVLVTAAVVVVRPGPTAVGSSAYSVAQVTAGLHQHPHLWVRRTVLVRGVLSGLRVSGSAITWQGWALTDRMPIGPYRANIPGQPGPLRFNVPGTIPSLIVQGEMPWETPLGRVQSSVRAALYRISSVARRAAPPPSGSVRPSLYRVQILIPARCPTAVASPCYTAFIRP